MHIKIKREPVTVCYEFWLDSKIEAFFFKKIIRSKIANSETAVSTPIIMA